MTESLSSSLVPDSTVSAPVGSRSLVVSLAPGVPSYRQRTILSGREYVLELRWSTRESCWYLDLRSAAGEALVLAMKVVVGWPLLYRFRGVDGVPPGELVACDPRLEPADPLLDELGDIVQLVYSEAA